MFRCSDHQHNFFLIIIIYSLRKRNTARVKRNMKRVQSSSKPANEKRTTTTKTTTTAKSRKSRDLRYLSFIFNTLFVFVGFVVALSFVFHLRTNKHKQSNQSSSSSIKNSTGKIEEDAKIDKGSFHGRDDTEELSKAREMLKAKYDFSYAKLFVNETMLERLNVKFERMSDEKRVLVWDEAVQKFYEREEYDVRGDRRRQMETHATMVPEIGAKEQFAIDDPERLRRLVALVKDRKENGAVASPSAAAGEKEKKTVLSAKEKNKQIIRSAALASFIAELFDALSREQDDAI